MSVGNKPAPDTWLWLPLQHVASGSRAAHPEVGLLGPIYTIFKEHLYYGQCGEYYAT